MKKLWIVFKLIIEAIDVLAERLSALVYVAIGYGIFGHLKWSWAERVESKLAYLVMKRLDRLMFSTGIILTLLEELGKDTSALNDGYDAKLLELDNLWKEASRIYGWRIVKIHGYTTLIK